LGSGRGHDGESRFGNVLLMIQLIGEFCRQSLEDGRSRLPNFSAGKAGT
jgi:hypothetical protein